MIFILGSLLQVLGDEVRPFRLDEEFDYDNVMLTPKFTPAEVAAFKEQLSKHKGENTNSDSGESRDWFTKTSSCLHLFCSYSSKHRINDKPTVSLYVEVYVCIDLSVTCL